MIIKIPENCVPERSYVIHVIFRTLLGLEYQLVIEKSLINTIILIDHHEYIFADAFFGAEDDPGVLYLNGPGAIEAKTGSGLLEGLIFLYGEDKVVNDSHSTTIYADIFSSAFFMLSRWEELNGEVDEHGRFLGTQSIAYQNEFIHRPVVNEYADFFRRILLNARLDVPQIHQFRKIFTCDVDMPFYWIRRPLRKLFGAFFRLRKDGPGFKEKWKSYRAFRKNIESDPYYTFDQFMDDATENDMQLMFNFMSGGKSKFDKYYSIKDHQIQKLVHKILEKGHTLGLHGSYHSFDNENMLLEEKSLLEEVSGQTIEYGRQHFLRFSIDRTLPSLEKANIKIDTTLGYADTPGFRNGICHRFPLFDLNQRKMLGVLELPLIIMDATLRYYLKCAPEEILETIQQLATEVRKHEGEFVFLWHNSSFDFGGYQGYRPVYNSLLSC